MEKNEGLTPKEELILKLIERENYKNEENIKLVVPSFLAKKIKSLMLIRLDIIHAISCTSEILKLKEIGVNNQLLEKSLFHSLIITYAKCFTENKGGYSQLNEKDCFKESDSEVLEIHKAIMKKRHEFVAHRDDTENEQATVFINIPKTEQIEIQSYISISAAQLSCPSVDIIIGYQRLLDFLKAKIDDKIQKQADKIIPSFNKMIDEVGREHLAKFIVSKD